jgi:hypothetical protein
MLFIRAAGGEFSWCARRGGVGRASGRSLDAAFSKAMDGSRDEAVEVGARDGEYDAEGDGGDVAG